MDKLMDTSLVLEILSGHPASDPLWLETVQASEKTRATMEVHAGAKPKAAVGGA
jgi:hypothetical protein